MCGRFTETRASFSCFGIMAGFNWQLKRLNLFKVLFVCVYFDRSEIRMINGLIHSQLTDCNFH